MSIGHETKKENSMTTDKTTNKVRQQKSDAPSEVQGKADQNKQSGKDSASHTKASTGQGAGGRVKQKRNH